jgi:hypothetical protein
MLEAAATYLGRTALGAMDVEEGTLAFPGGGQVASQCVRSCPGAWLAPIVAPAICSTSIATSSGN